MTKGIRIFSKKKRKKLIQDSEKKKNKPTVSRSQNQVGSSRIVKERKINCGEILTCSLWLSNSLYFRCFSFHYSVVTTENGLIMV